MYLPKRDELSFRTVFALPKAATAREEYRHPHHHSTAPTFENRIGVENLLLDPRVLPAARGQELQNQFRRFGLAAAALAADDDALIVLVPLHTPVGIVADGEDVRREFADLLVRVLPDVIAIVDVEQLVGIDSDQNRARERLRRRESTGVAM